MKRDEQAAGFRHARLQGLLFEELRALLSDDVSDPDLHEVAIVALVLSVDYRHARVHFAISSRAGGAPRIVVERALARATPFLRRRLGDALDLKIVPDLRFVFEAAHPVGGDEA